MDSKTYFTHFNYDEKRADAFVKYLERKNKTLKPHQNQLTHMHVMFIDKTYYSGCMDVNQLDFAIDEIYSRAKACYKRDCKFPADAVDIFIGRQYRSNLKADLDLFVQDNVITQRKDNITSQNGVVMEAKSILNKN